MKGGGTDGAGWSWLSEEELELIKQAEREAERQKRIAHTQEMALRRIGKRDLFRGWCAWHDMWAARARRKRQRAEVVHKGGRPRAQSRCWLQLNRVTLGSVPPS